MRRHLCDSLWPAPFRRLSQAVRYRLRGALDIPTDRVSLDGCPPACESIGHGRVPQRCLSTGRSPLTTVRFVGPLVSIAMRRDNARLAA